MDNIIIEDLEFQPFISQSQIEQRIKLMTDEINNDYKGKTPVFIGVLNGCFMFMSDLLKEIAVECEMTFVKLASYHGTNQGIIQELLGLGIELTGRDVIIVEDIIDTGNSLKHTLEALAHSGAASISVCSLLIKPSCLQHSFDIKMYTGFEIEREFVVGYGLDYNGKGRNLKHIYKVCS